MIPAGITREDVLEALRALDGGTAVPNAGESTKSDMVYEGRRYAPKAVISLAARRVLGGEMLSTAEFSGGDSPGAANVVLRQLGFDIVAKGSAAREVSVDDSTYIGWTLDTLIAEMLAGDEARPFADLGAWAVNGDAVRRALMELDRSGDHAAFSQSFIRLPNQPPWFFNGPYKPFITTIAERSADPNRAAVFSDVFAAPTDEGEAARKILRLKDLAETTDRLYPGVGFVPNVCAMLWCFQDPESWPYLSTEAESVLTVLRVLPKTNGPDERYLAYRAALATSSHDFAVTTAGVAAAINGSRSVSPSIYARLAENSDLMATYADGRYPSEADEQRAARNIAAVLGEFDLLAKGMVEPVGAQLVRSLVTSKTDPRTAFEMSAPSRADGYAILTVEKDMTKPAIRIWATKSGLAIGAHFGSRKYGEAFEMGSKLAVSLPSGTQFFRVREHKSGDRLEPIGRTPVKGELFVGEWFEGGLTGDIGDQIMKTVARLQPVFDQMVIASGEAGTTVATENDPLAADIDAFLSQTGYPTEADKQDKAEREQMASVISEEGLLAFDLPEFRRIFNTGRYGAPGPQSILNTSLGQMSSEQLDWFASNLEYLLRGADPLATRVNALMNSEDRGVKGFGESVITKLLAIEHHTEILPVFVYRGPKGKATLLSSLGLRDESLDTLDVGTRLVRSNQLLRERLAPFFGDDTFGMARFLYWLSERPDAEEEEADPIDWVGNLADAVLYPRETIEEFVALLEDKGQIIFYGPPGTGKTYLARELAKALAPDPRHRMLVQFHPSTSYEDFFEGFRPETGATGQLTYRLVKGPLALIAERAKEHPSQRFVMVIDEINRANLPKVFGELLFLLEYREETVRSLYRPDEPFELPKNLLFIGTMNTADRSIALVDAAMRRRFHFVGAFPDSGPMAGLLERWLQAKGESDYPAILLNQVNAELMERLGGPHLQVGPSHFMKPGLTEAGIKRIWEYSIFPYIEEQLYGDTAGIKSFAYDQVRARVAKNTAAVTPEGSPTEASEETFEEGDVDDHPTPGMA